MNCNRQYVMVGSAIYIDDVSSGELYGNCSDNLLHDSTCTMMESIENKVNAWHYYCVFFKALVNGDGNFIFLFLIYALFLNYF